MGKYVPPEFSTGGVVAFLLLAFQSVPLSVSLIMGLFASLLMIGVFEAKIRINKIFAAHLKYPAAAAVSIAASYALYFIILSGFVMLSLILRGGLSQNSSLVVFSLLTLPFFYAVRLKSRNEPLYFILGIAFGGMLTWINLFYF